MPTSLQFRRGTAVQNDSFTGAAGELSIDLTNNTIRVHDGSTAGGTRLAKYSEIGSGSGGSGVDSTAVSALIDSALNATSLFDPAGTDNSTDVTLTGSYDYITIAGQAITVNQIDAATDIVNIEDLVDSAYVQARQSASGGTDVIFKTVAVSGQDDIVAGTTTDTLNVAAGTGITLTTNAGTNTLTITSSGGSGTTDSAAVSALIDSALSAASGVDFDPVGTDNSTNVTLTGSYDYLTLSGQQITLGQIDATTDISGLATVATSGAYADLSDTPNVLDSVNVDALIDSALTAASGVSFDPVGTDNSTDVTLTGSYDYLTLSGQQITLGQIDASTDITGLAAVATSGAYADLSGTPDAITGGTGVTVTSGEVAIGQAVGTSDTVTFSGLTVSGNLTVTGTTTTVDNVTLTVQNPIIHLADSNETSDAVDIGFIGHYSDDGGSTKRHTGLVRDASNEQYYLFNGLVQATLDSTSPAETITVGGTGWTLASLNVGTVVGDLTGDVTGTVSSISNHSTTDLTEGDNLYYTQARVDSAIGAKVDSDYVQLRVPATYIQANQTAQDFAFGSLTGTPTTISGYGITDAFDGAFGSLSGTPTTIAGYGITDAYDSTNFQGQLDSAIGTSVQAFLVSGTDIKTINSQSLLGSGDITISSGSSGNAFSVIAVSGQDSVVADSTGDTLTLVAGSGITITTTAASDQVTIAATGGGGGASNARAFTYSMLFGG